MLFKTLQVMEIFLQDYGGKIENTNDGDRDGNIICAYQIRFVCRIFYLILYYLVQLSFPKPLSLPH